MLKILQQDILIYFSILRYKDIILYLINKLLDLSSAYRSLVTCTQNTCLYLLSVVGFTDIILLDDDKRDGLNLLICCKPLAALIANTPAPDGSIVLSRS